MAKVEYMRDLLEHNGYAMVDGGRDGRLGDFRIYDRSLNLPATLENVSAIVVQEGNSFRGIMYSEDKKLIVLIYMACGEIV